MRIAVISDIHGNNIYLQHVIRDLETKKIDRIFALGDYCGYMPEVNEVIAELIRNDVYALLGNHDAMMCNLLKLPIEKDEIYKISHNKLIINCSNKNWLNSLLPFYECEICNKKILFVHGSPWNPLSDYVYSDSDLTPFGFLKYDYVFMGNTHRLFIAQVGNKKIVNAGSVGLPRDEGNKPGYVILDLYQDTIEYVKLIVNEQEVIERYSEFIHEQVKQVLNRKEINQNYEQN